MRTGSFPFNGAWRLRRDVIHYAVHAAHLIHDPIRNGLQHLIRQRNPVGGHAVFRMHGSDGAGVSVGTLIAHYSYRHYRQEHGERLPDFLIQSSLLDLAYNDVVALTQQVGAFFGYFTQDSHRQSRAWERLALQNLLGHAEIAADAPDFIFK